MEKYHIEIADLLSHFLNSLFIQCIEEFVGGQLKFGGLNVLTVGYDASTRNVDKELLRSCKNL